MRETLKKARTDRKWSQAELGKQVGLPQTHISGIESGRIVPRFDTLLDLVRVLDFDLLLVRDRSVRAFFRVSRMAAGRLRSRADLICEVISHVLIRC